MNAARSCAFLTLEDRGDFCIYDQLLFEPLADLGWQVQEIPWNRKGVDWASFDVVVIRSTWDYQKDLDAFLTVLEHIEAVTTLLNPLSVCRWNSHKGYLAELAERGVPIVPTRFATGLDADLIARGFEVFATQRMVAKPAIGANADDAYVLSAARPPEWAAAITALAGRDLLLQPFVDSVVEEGEYSLFYFGNGFSHAIRKRPAAGDFRVQEEHGGDIRPCSADEAMVDAGRACLEVLEERLLYARIDLVRLADGTLAVMEVELIEPSLYFDQDPTAPARFARVFDAMVTGLG